MWHRNEVSKFKKMVPIDSTQGYPKPPFCLKKKKIQYLWSKIKWDIPVITD